MSIICKCGCENSDNAQFCSVCGQPIEHNSQPVQQAAPQQPVYQQAAPQQPVYSTVNNNVQIQGEEPISILGWIGYFILFGIPIVNIITYIVILCSSKNKTLKNLIIAQIILGVLLVIPVMAAIVVPSFIGYMEKAGALALFF